MATLQERLTTLIQAIGTDIKGLTTKQGNLAALDTTEKSNLVGAINELFGLIDTGGASDVIDDAAESGDDKTYSIDKILDLLNDLKDSILGGASEAFDTLQELESALSDDDTAISGLLSAVGKRVSVEAQSFTTGEKTQARANIGALSAVEIGDPDTDLSAIYTTAKS